MTHELNELQVAIRDAWPDRRPMPERLVRALSAAQTALRKEGVEVATGREDELDRLRDEARQLRAKLEAK